jgi:hypothetical protein
MAASRIHIIAPRAIGPVIAVTFEALRSFGPGLGTRRQALQDLTQQLALIPLDIDQPVQFRQQMGSLIVH